MTVTETQIQELYRFTRQHFVEHYDVQTELVDHLANDIESQWEEKPELSMEEALNIAFKKFGVFGFQDVVSARANALNKHYWASVWTIFKQFFTLPKIILTTALLCFTYLCLSLTPVFKYTLGGIVVVYLIVFSIRAYQINKSIKREQKATGRKWLYQDIVSSLGYLGVYANLVVQLASRIPYLDAQLNPLYLSLLCVFIVSFGILSYIILFEVPKKITLYLKQEYKAYYV